MSKQLTISKPAIDRMDRCIQETKDILRRIEEMKLPPKENAADEKKGS